jgi:hypothetical protein
MTDFLEAIVKIVSFSLDDVRTMEERDFFLFGQSQS